MMGAAVIRFVLTAAALPACAYYLEGIQMLSWQNTLLAGLILAGIYTLLRPLARRLLAVINYPLLMLLYLVVESWIIYTAASIIPESVTFAGFWWIAVPAAAAGLLRLPVDALCGDLHY